MEWENPGPRGDGEGKAAGLQGGGGIHLGRDLAQELRNIWIPPGIVVTCG